MNGVIYPEISNMSNAQIGGYLSNSAASQLATFKTNASRPRFTTGLFDAASGHSVGGGAYQGFKINFTVPTGYATIGAIGGQYLQTHCFLSGYYASASAGTIIGQGGTYVSGTTTPRVQVLFKRT